MALWCLTSSLGPVSVLCIFSPHFVCKPRTAIIALKPGSAAVIALIFAEYMNRIFVHGQKADVTPDDVSQIGIKLTAVGSIVLVTLLCVKSALAISLVS